MGLTIYLMGRCPDDLAALAIGYYLNLITGHIVKSTVGWELS